MSLPTEASGQTADPHDCCKKGLTGRMPSCCHADRAPNASATLKGAWAVTMLPAVSIWILPAAVQAPSAFTALPSVSSHSPPPTVLRI